MSDISKLRIWPKWDDLVADSKEKWVSRVSGQLALDAEVRRIANGRKYAARNCPGGYEVTSENGDTVFGKVLVK